MFVSVRAWPLVKKFPLNIRMCYLIGTDDSLNGQMIVNEFFISW